MEITKLGTARRVRTFVKHRNSSRPAFEESQLTAVESLAKLPDAL
jgi:hypothetical protein